MKVYSQRIEVPRFEERIVKNITGHAAKVSLALILLGLMACDNVEWGGASLRLESTISEDDSTEVGETDSATVDEVERHIGPVLFFIEHDNGRGSLIPVGEIGPSGLTPLPAHTDENELLRDPVAERLSLGTELTLFAFGTRVGTFIVDTAPEIDRSYCARRLRVLGILELRLAAVDAPHFLALGLTSGDEAELPSPPDRPYRTIESVRSQREVTIDMFIDRLQNLPASEWPPDLVAARADLQILELDGRAPPAIVATFLHGDQLGVSSPAERAYSVFLIAEDTGAGYQRSFEHVNLTADTPKAVPRLLDYLDWDGDGRDEILLHVFGDDTKSFASLERSSQGWSTGLQEDCAPELMFQNRR